MQDCPRCKGTGAYEAMDSPEDKVIYEYPCNCEELHEFILQFGAGARKKLRAKIEKAHSGVMVRKGE